MDVDSFIQMISEVLSPIYFFNTLYEPYYIILYVLHPRDDESLYSNDIVKRILSFLTNHIIHI